jgi:hypothetical protein
MNPALLISSKEANGEIRVILLHFSMFDQLFQRKSAKVVLEGSKSCRPRKCKESMKAINK